MKKNMLMVKKSIKMCLKKMVSIVKQVMNFLVIDPFQTQDMQGIYDKQNWVHQCCGELQAPAMLSRSDEHIYALPPSSLDNILL